MHIYICSCSSTARSYALRMRVCMCICTYIYIYIHTIYIYIYIQCIYMSACTDRHTFQLQHDMEINTSFQVKLFGMELVAKCRIQASLLVATGMVSSLKSQLSCFLSRPTWNISISQRHALLDRHTHYKSW